MQPFYAVIYPVGGGVGGPGGPGGPIDPGWSGGIGHPGGPGGGLGTWGPGSPIHGQLPSPGGPGPGLPPGINYPTFPSQLPMPGGPGPQPPQPPGGGGNWVQGFVPGQGWTWVYVGPVPGHDLPGGPPNRPDNTLPGGQPGVDNTLPTPPTRPVPPPATPKR